MALQLRAMNIIYETTLERGATILLPSSMVDSLNPSAQFLGLAMAENEAVKPNGGLSAVPPGVAPAARSAAWLNRPCRLPGCAVASWVHLAREPGAGHQFVNR